MAETEWLEDYLTDMLSSQAFVNPLADFVDEHSSLFDDDSPEGNYLTHTDCHRKFLELLEGQLESGLASVGLTPEDFAQLCQSSPPTGRLRQIVDRLMYVDDFMFFKKLMAKRNAELNMEAIREMNRAAEAAASAAAAAEAAASAAAAAAAEVEGVNEEEALRLALEMSQADDRGSSRHHVVVGPEDEDAELAAALKASLAEVGNTANAQAWEAAMLEAAIQASLALEEERRRVEAEKAAAAAKEAASAAKAAPQAVPPVAAPVTASSPPPRARALGGAAPPVAPALHAPPAPAAASPVVSLQSEVSSPTAAVPAPVPSRVEEGAPPAAPTASPSATLPPLRARASRSELLDFGLIPAVAATRDSACDDEGSGAGGATSGASSGGGAGISQEEIRLRQAHLRKQRDALVAKKAKERAAGGGGGSLPMLGGKGGGGGQAGAPQQQLAPPAFLVGGGPTDATLQRVRDTMAEVKRAAAPAAAAADVPGPAVQFTAGTLEQQAASMQHRLAAEFRNA